MQHGPIFNVSMDDSVGTWFEGTSWNQRALQTWLTKLVGPRLDDFMVIVNENLAPQKQGRVHLRKQPKGL